MCGRGTRRVLWFFHFDRSPGSLRPRVAPSSISDQAETKTQSRIPCLQLTYYPTSSYELVHSGTAVHVPGLFTDAANGKRSRIAHPLKLDGIRWSLKLAPGFKPLECPRKIILPQTMAGTISVSEYPPLVPRKRRPHSSYFGP